MSKECTARKRSPALFSERIFPKFVGQFNLRGNQLGYLSRSLLYHSYLYMPLLYFYTCTRTLEWHILSYDLAPVFTTPVQYYCAFFSTKRGVFLDPAHQ